MSESDVSRERMLDEAIAQYLKARDAGHAWSRENFVARHPAIAAELSAFLDNQARFDLLALRERLAPRIAEPRSEASVGPAGAWATRVRLDPAEARRTRMFPGSVFTDRYRIFDVRSGGMGRVYFAEDLDIGRDGVPAKVAIKSVADFEEWKAAIDSERGSSEPALYDNLLTRFRREALTWVKLGMHPNIIWAMWVVDVGDKPYLVMEYADGGDLRTWIRDRRLTLATAISFATQVCEGMKHAVSTGNVIHRDIKPANVLVTNDGIAKVTDFGLATAFDSEPDTRPDIIASGETTTSHFAAGTQAYMAPEQFRGLRYADTRSDIFSFGATLFEMFTGVPLFVERTAAEHAQAALRLPVVHEFVPEVPPAVSQLVSKCLEYDPQLRFQSFESLSLSLRRIHADLPDSVPLPIDEAHSRRAPLLTPSSQLVGETYSLISLGRYAEAVRRADDGIRVDPTNSEHWINKGKAVAELGDFQAARVSWLEAARLAPDDARTRANLGWASLMLGDAPTALAQAQLSIELDGGFGDAWMCRGACERTLARPAAAVTSLKQAVRLDPNNWKAHAKLAESLLDLERSHEALEVLNRATTLNPRDAWCWTRLAWVLSREASWEAAKRAIDRSLALDDSSAMGWALRAWILFGMGADVAEVGTSLRAALEIDPGNALAKKIVRAMGDKP
jgi:serine/threonine protein kinase